PRRHSDGHLRPGGGFWQPDRQREQQLAADRQLHDHRQLPRQRQFPGVQHHDRADHPASHHAPPHRPPHAPLPPTPPVPPPAHRPTCTPAPGPLAATGGQPPVAPPIPPWGTNTASIPTGVSRTGGLLGAGLHSIKAVYIDSTFGLSASQDIKPYTVNPASSSV